MRTKNSRSLRLDRQFVPAPADDGDEFFPNGIFTFNITKMILFINSHQADFTPEPVAVRDHAGKLSSLSQAVLDCVHNTDPVILAEIAPGDTTSLTETTGWKRPGGPDRNTSWPTR